ncbi:MAG: 30S ribosomal protein S8 [Limnochordales bacterium]|nr:30S ribosomal protein S8 [Limnochordales bacterium]
MAITDPVGDMLTRLRNAYAARHERVDVPHSRFKLELARILKEEGYIRGYEVITVDSKPVLRLHLKYGEGRRAALTGIRRISKPGLRIYVSKDRVPRVLGGLGVAILTTPQGVMSDREARRRRIGGEVVCYVW